MQETPRRQTRVLRYTLGPADRLAFAMLRHQLTGWEKLRLLVILGIAGLLAGMLPEAMGAVAWWAAVAVILGVGAAAAILWSNVEIRRKAAALDVPDGAVELDDRGDILSERSATGEREIAIEDVAQVVTTDRHVFIRAGLRPVIIPAAAFVDGQDMAAFAAALDEARRARD